MVPAPPSPHPSDRGPSATRYYCTALGLGPADLPDQNDREQWPVLRQRLSEVIATRERDHWATVFAETDACVTLVLSLHEAPTGQHLAHRGGTLIEMDSVRQPTPAPRFSRTPSSSPTSPRQVGVDTDDVLEDWLGVSACYSTSEHQ